MSERMKELVVTLGQEVQSNTGPKAGWLHGFVVSVYGCPFQKFYSPPFG